MLLRHSQLYVGNNPIRFVWGVLTIARELFEF